MYPAAQVVVNYGSGSPELWNRNRKHEDFLCQRLGTGNLPFQMEINVPKEKFTLVSDELSEKPGLIKQEYSILYDVPVNVNLLGRKLIGVVGGERKQGAFDIVRLLTAQIAANNCYTDVKLVYLYDKIRTTRTGSIPTGCPMCGRRTRRPVTLPATNRRQAMCCLS